jgi:hypothetical protein
VTVPGTGIGGVLFSATAMPAKKRHMKKVNAIVFIPVFIFIPYSV